MSLAEKIAKASIGAGNFLADKTNREQNYSYISADQVLSRAGDALAREGVVIIPSLMDEEIESVPYGNQGKNRFDARVTFNMVITDGAETIESVWYGRGSDYAVPDKALYKAITSGHKYFEMKLLNIGIGNEDGEHEDEPKPEPKKPAQEQKKAPANIPAPTSLMTVEMAKSIKNREGISYGDIDTDTLGHMLNSIQKVMDKNGLTAEEKEQHQIKKDAILVILKSRQ